MNQGNWELSKKRFVAFFDVLGFKELVESSTHQQVLARLRSLKQTIARIEDSTFNKVFRERNMDSDQTRTVTFSDSNIVFSKSDGYNDALKILFDCHSIVRDAIQNGIPIKAALAYGEITVDFEESLFFGRPIIDAYLLHDDLQMIGTILHHTFEVKIREYQDELLTCVFSDFRVFLKSGRIVHCMMHPHDKTAIEGHRANLVQLRNAVSGKPRLYIDNTVDFLAEISAVK